MVIVLQIMNIKIARPVTPFPKSANENTNYEQELDMLRYYQILNSIA
jgi:hypothetical protein